LTGSRKSLDREATHFFSNTGVDPDHFVHTRLFDVAGSRHVARSRAVRAKRIFNLHRQAQRTSGGTQFR
jgi:hypothetical protein